MCWVPSTVWHLKHPCSAAMRRPCSTRLPRMSTSSEARGWPSWAAACSSARCSVEPLVELGRRHHHQLAEHGRVAEAAVLGAEDRVAAGLGGLEPGLGVAARKRVLLEPQRRDEEGVDDVARGDEQPHRPARRARAARRRARAARVGELPHPLLAPHVDVHRVLGRRLQRHVLREADGEPEEEEGRAAPRRRHLVDGSSGSTRGVFSVSDLRR